MRRYFCLLLLGLMTGLFASTADAGQVLMIGPNPSGLFSDGGLAQYGHSVTIGPNYDVFDGTFDLSGYDVIVLSAVVYNLPYMPDAGQQAIVDFVTNGGGLITGEWTTWRGGTFATLAPLFPTTTDGSYIGGAGMEVSVRYSQVTADPVINAGLPSSMDFVVNSAGSEIIVPKPGATVFYSGDSISPYYIWYLGVPTPFYEVFPSAGLVGWDYGLGRVMNFSTTLQQPVGPDYTDNYSRLVANAIDWAGAGSTHQVPEPGSMTLLALGGVSVVGVRLRRRRS
ncbi:MAG: PEP-CTERM sorting domain-containing protein [Planctomycetaceae bacterium]|nr:PEP-CTERM sorting domain-containing protein [Planctomycetaceae bacterium]